MSHSQPPDIGAGARVEKIAAVLEPTSEYDPLHKDQLDEWVSSLNKDLSRGTVEEFLLELPNETNPEYYNQLRYLFQIRDVSRLLKILEEILESPSKVADSSRPVSVVQFGALYFIVSYHRRKDNTGIFNYWMDRMEDLFSDLLMYKYQRAILYREQNRFPDAIDNARRVTKQLPTNYPIAHGFAHNIVHAIEEGFVDSLEREQLAKEAIEALEPALEALPDDGKIYATMGRAQAAAGNYEAALDFLKTSIKKEDSKQNDYGERVALYRFHQMQIMLDQYQEGMSDQVSEAQADIQRSVESAEEKVDTIHSRVLEFIGFFAGLLAIAVTSTEIATSLDPTAALRLIIVMVSGLICAFASLGLLLPIQRNRNHVLAAIGLGIAGLVFGLYFVPSTF
jgi:tetratricopeptide (TPR) repeat protein